MPDTYTKAEATEKAKTDFYSTSPPAIDTLDSGIRKIYFDVYYSLRTNANLKHVFDKYPNLK